MSFTAKDVQALREKTGCGMMDCKKALTETNGDSEKAIEILREKGLAAAAKKSGRIAAEGLVTAIVDNEKNIGVILEVNSETDFVAKNQEFVNFVDAIAKTIIQFNPSNLEELNTLTLFGTNNTVEEALREKILTIGENMKIRRFERLEGCLASYVHGNGRIGVLVQFNNEILNKSNTPEFSDYGKSIAMQVAASYPQFINKESVPSEVINKEREILLAQALNEGKPQNIAEKMVEGRMSKYYKDVCLLDQPFIKDMDISVDKYTKDTSKSLGSEIKILKFVRFEKGEGIEKKEDNFANEVSEMMGK